MKVLKMMRNYCATKMPVFFMLLLVGAGCTNRVEVTPPDNDNYFPLAVGNKWVYQSVMDSAFVWTYEITGQQNIGGNNYFVMERRYTPTARDTVFFRKQGDRIFINRQNQELLYIDFARETGSQWETFNGYKGQILSKNAAGKTLAVDFKQGIEILFDLPQYVDDEQWHVYAKGIGLVKISLQIGLMMLKSAVINGVTYPLT